MYMILAFKIFIYIYLHCAVFNTSGTRLSKFLIGQFRSSVRLKNGIFHNACNKESIFSWKNIHIFVIMVSIHFSYDLLFSMWFHLKHSVLELYLRKTNTQEALFLLPSPALRARIMVSSYEKQGRSVSYLFHNNSAGALSWACRNRSIYNPFIQPVPTMGRISLS